MNWTELKNFPELNKNNFSYSVAMGRDGNIYAAFPDPQTGRARISKYDIISNVWDHNYLLDLSAGPARNICLKFDTANKGYLVYRGENEGNRVVVQNLVWTVPHNKPTIQYVKFAAKIIVSTFEGDDISLEIDKLTNKPFIAFAEGGHNDKFDPKPRVMHLTTTGWQDVVPGQQYVSSMRGDFLALAIDNFGKPYIAFRDYGFDTNLKRGRLRTLNNTKTAWVDVPSSNGFLSNYGGLGSISIVFNSHNILYVAYSDNGGRPINCVQLRKFGINKAGTGEEWEDIDTFSYANSSSLTIDKDDNLYLSVINLEEFGKPLVYKYKADVSFIEHLPFASEMPGKTLVNSSGHANTSIMIRTKATNTFPILTYPNFNVFDRTLNLEIWEGSN